MKKLLQIAAVIAAVLFVSSVPAVAGGNSYASSRPIWNGEILVVNATTGSSIEGAYVIGKNIPTGAYSLGIAIVTRDDGRVYDKTNNRGRARAMVGPFGTLVAWMPGFWPARFQAMIQTETGLPSPDSDGIVTISLKPAHSPAERRNAAIRAAEWLEPAKRAPFVRLGRRANRSADYRAETREQLIKEGALFE